MGAAFWTDIFKIKENTLSCPILQEQQNSHFNGNNVFKTCAAFIINCNGWQWQLGSMLRGRADKSIGPVI